MYDLTRTIDAKVEPVTLAQAKAHCRVEITDDDALIGVYITAARQICEQVTGRAFLQQTWRLSLELFPQTFCRTPAVPGIHTGPYGMLPWWRPPAILLPRPQLLGISSVTYLDTTGTRQTLDPGQYVANTDAEPANLSPAIGAAWPAALWRRGSVQVTFTSGYGTDPARVPAPLQLAILMLVGHWYENREATVLPDSGTGLVPIPMGVADLLSPYTLDVFTLES